MKRKEAQTIGQFLEEFLKDSNLGTKLQEEKVISAWGELLGEQISNYTTRLYIQNRTLHVQLSSSVLRSELYMCRSMLVERLNRAAGASVIDNINIR